MQQFAWDPQTIFLIIIAFLVGVAITYVTVTQKVSIEVGKTHIDVLNNYEETLEVRDQIEYVYKEVCNLRNEPYKVENIVKHFSDSLEWELDSVWDDVSGKTTVFKPKDGNYEKSLPADYVVDITLDENITYSVAVPKRIYLGLKKLLRQREAVQELMDYPYSQRPYHSEMVREPKPADSTPAPEVVVAPPGGILNPALVAAMTKRNTNGEST